MNTQAWIHWLEQGRGARSLRLLCLLVAVVALSLTVAYKQFHGPRTEETMRQVDLGRSLANGQGFTSSVNYPQVYAVLAERTGASPLQERLPEVYQAPGYAMVVGAVLGLLPDARRQALFADAPNPPDGFADAKLTL